MQSSVSFRRILVLSGMHVAALVLGPAALAQSVLPVERGPGLERLEGSPSTDSVAMTFEGVVLRPDGPRCARTPNPSVRTRTQADNRSLGRSKSIDTNPIPRSVVPMSGARLRVRT